MQVNSTGEDGPAGITLLLTASIGIGDAWGDEKIVGRTMAIPSLLCAVPPMLGMNGGIGSA